MIYDVEDGRVIADLDDFSTSREQKWQRKPFVRSFPTPSPGDQRYVESAPLGLSFEELRDRSECHVADDDFSARSVASVCTVDVEAPVQMFIEQDGVLGSVRSRVPGQSLIRAASHSTPQPPHDSARLFRSAEFAEGGDIADTCLMPSAPSFITQARLESDSSSSSPCRVAIPLKNRFVDAVPPDGAR